MRQAGMSDPRSKHSLGILRQDLHMSLDNSAKSGGCCGGKFSTCPSWHRQVENLPPRRCIFLTAIAAVSVTILPSGSVLRQHFGGLTRLMKKRRTATVSKPCGEGV